MNMETEQRHQESQYAFPYHHVVKFSDRSFSHMRDLGWGVEYAAHTTAVLDTLKHTQFNSLLDVGCGDGKLLFETKKIFADKILEGVDYSENAIRFAQAFSPKLVFHVGDITDAQTLSGKKYDVITLIEVFEHIPPKARESFVTGLFRLLNDGGKLIITVPSANTPVHERHYEHFTKETLAKALKSNFAIEETHFLHMIGVRSKLIRTLMSNRLFALKQHKTRAALYRYYKKHLLHAKEKTGKNILMAARKKTEAIV